MAAEPTIHDSTSASAGSDPVVRQLREQISDTDRAIVDALNKRLKLVSRMKAY